MSTGYVVTSPNTTYSYANQSGNGGTYNVDSWNPDEYAAGDEYYGTISGRDTSSQFGMSIDCLLYTSPSPRDRQKSRMPSSA